jgi:hypothetical protein
MQRFKAAVTPAQAVCAWLGLGDPGLRGLDELASENGLAVTCWGQDRRIYGRGQTQLHLLQHGQAICRLLRDSEVDGAFRVFLQDYNWELVTELVEEDRRDSMHSKMTASTVHSWTEPVQRRGRIVEGRFGRVC